MKEGTSQHKLIAAYKAVPVRARVFTISLILLILYATALCGMVAIKFLTIHPGLFSLWYSILAGPFAALWTFSDESNWVTIGLVNFAFLFAHPIWPNRGTAALTLLAFASWLFWGAVLSFSGV